MGARTRWGMLFASLWVAACAPRAAPEVLAESLELEGGAQSAEDAARLERLGRDIDHVRSLLDRELRLRRKLTSYHQSAGLLLLRQRAYKGAASHFALALRETADNSMLFYYFGYALAQQLPILAGEEHSQMVERAQRAYQSALRLNGRNSKALYALAALYALEGEQHAQAAQLLDRYLEQRQVDGQERISNLQDIKALFLRARTAYILGQPKQARGFYRRISEGAVEEQWRAQAEKLLHELGG